MPPKLTVHNAEIRTATVEIKTLTLSGKQVTLAVFRQLRARPLISNSGEFLGEPWGTVNYCPRQPCTSGPHWHTVWQSGTTLYRSTDCSAPLREPFEPESGSNFLNSVVLDLLTDGTPYFDQGRSLPVIGPSQPFAHRHPATRPTTREGVHAIGQEVSELLPAGSRIFASEAAVRAYRYPTAVSAIDRLRAEVAEVGMSTSELHARYRAEVDAEVKRRERIREALLRLAELPQLFIAA
jgi:hypothetical protein